MTWVSKSCLIAHNMGALAVLGNPSFRFQSSFLFVFIHISPRSSLEIIDLLSIFEILRLIET